MFFFWIIVCYDLRDLYVQVRRISQLVLRREHAFINTVDADFPDSNPKVE